MKNLLLAPLFKLFNKSTFLSSLNQNSCPVLDAEDIKKQEQKEAIEKYGTDKPDLRFEMLINDFKPFSD